MIVKITFCTLTLGNGSIASTARFQDMLLHFFDSDSVWRGTTYSRQVPDISNTLDKIFYLTLEESNWERGHHLVKAGADPNGIGAMLALEDATIDGEHGKVIRLLQLGTSVDGNSNTVPLRSRAYWQKPETVKFLIQLGANPDGRAEGANPPEPLHWAIGRCWESAKALILAGADTERRDPRGRTPLDEAEFVDFEEPQWNRVESIEFLAAVKKREDEVGMAVSAILKAEEKLPVQEIIGIISATLGIDFGDPRWNPTVLSVSFILKRQGFDLFEGDDAYSLLSGNWSPKRVALVGKVLAIFAKMNLRLVVFEHLAAPFLLEADNQTLFRSRVMSLGLDRNSNPFRFGYHGGLRERLLSAEGDVGRTMIGAVGLPRTISFFRNFYSRRFAIVKYLSKCGFPENIIIQIDELLYGRDGIIADLWRSMRAALIDFNT